MRSLIAAKRMPSAEELELQCVLRARGMDDIADELLLSSEHPGVVGIKLIGVPSVDPPLQASQVPLDHPYASGKAINLGVTTLAAAGGSTAADLITAGFSVLTMFWRLGNATTPATAAADCNPALIAYEDDGTTLYPAGTVTGLTPDFVPKAALLVSSFAIKVERYILAGIDKVRVQLANNNATTALQGGTAIYYLQK